MYKKTTPLFLVCETPLHAGSGDSLGVVDLPIQRERHTSFPKIEGSSLKGAIRQAFEGQNPECTSDASEYQTALELAFGPENAGDKGYAGAVGFTDARLLLFPVKSMKGVFAWVTCPKVLQQFHRDMLLTEFKDRDEIAYSLAVNALTTPLECTGDVSGSCNLFLKNDSKKIVLEEYTFEIENKESPELAYLLKFLAEQIFPVQRGEGKPDSYAFWRSKLMTDVVVLPDEDFTDFVNLSTEVITRTKINNETGTVAKGQLFTEEYLPSESVMYSLVLASPIFKENDADKGIFSMNHDSPCFTGYKNEESKVMEFFRTALPDVIQIGGNATLGKGLVRAKMFSFSSDTENGGAEDAGE